MDACPQTNPAPRVLVVEPHQGLRDMITDLLRSVGLSVLATGDRATAISTAAVWQPTVAVVEPHQWRQSDVDGDGEGLIAALHAADADLPVVVHTAMIAPGAPPLPQRLGAVASVVKGSAPGELLAAIQHAHLLACGCLPARAGVVGVAR